MVAGICTKYKLRQDHEIIDAVCKASIKWDRLVKKYKNKLKKFVLV